MMLTRLILFLLLSVCNASDGATGGGMLLRIRLEDGSMQKIKVPEDKQDSWTLSQILGEFKTSDDATIQVGPKKISDPAQPLSALPLKHGSLITLLKKKSPKDAQEPKAKPSFISDSSSSTWHPFPDLARDYHSALRQKARRRGTSGGMSYGDLANIQSELHIVEPQNEGSLKRLYMCRISGERFRSSCITKGRISSNRVGLMFGTVQRERVDSHRAPKTRTSLSSTPSAQDYCQVGKVHAIWEPTGQAGTEKAYDPKNLLNESACQKVLKIAKLLDLQPIGWVFTYNENREDDDSLPVWGLDVHTGATLQKQQMKSRGRSDGKPFMTVAMDAKSGAVEAFQLSDVAVQMVSENMLSLEKKINERFIKTRHAILVDGQETSQLDSVLCLVNTALLAHEGLYAGATTSSIKKNGSLKTGAKKALLAALDSDEHALPKLCDLNMLVALSALLSESDLEDLCRLVKKYARGQKKGTQISSSLKLSLKSVLSTS